MFTIGIVNEDYNWWRNITRHQYPDFQLRRARDLYALVKPVYRRIRRDTLYLERAHRPLLFPRVDLFHLWGAVSYTKRPWLVTTSVGLPFGWPKSLRRKGMELLASDPCKRIIANSKSALELQRSKAEKYPDLYDRVMAKMEVLYPPQDPQVGSWEEKAKYLGDEITFSLVGHVFFLKGGREIVKVIDRLAKAGAPVRLNIVSRFKPDPHTGATQKDIDEIRAVIDRQPCITYYESLSNEEVLELFKRSHVGLLPSYADAFGYSILEAQACACPTISTDIRALAEINDDTVGWIIEAGGENPHKTEEGRAELSERIEQGLERIITNIIEDPSVLATKGQAALSRIQREHAPKQHAERLRSIYQDIVRK